MDSINMGLINRVNPKEWYFVFLLSITVVTITVIPLVVGYLMQNENYRFVGFVSPHEDVNSYLSWMKQAKEGHILFETHSRHFGLPAAHIALPCAINRSLKCAQSFLSVTFIRSSSILTGS